MEVVEGKTFGWVGSLMILLDLYLGYLGVKGVGLLAILGLLFVLYGVREISREANYPRIFRNYFIFFIFAALFFILQTFTSNLVLLWILLLIGAFFMRRSFKLIEMASEVPMFRYVYLIFLIGAVLFIAIVGLLLLPVALALQVVAFCSIPETLKQIQEEIQQIEPSLPEEPKLPEEQPLE